MKDIFTAEQEANTAEGEEVDADAVQKKVDELEKTKQLKSSISNEDAKTWAYADTTKVGDKYTVTDDEAGTYTVYMITKTAYRDEELTKNMGVITLTDSNYDDANAKAEEIVAEWEAGDKTEDSFFALGEKYSESSHNHLEKNYNSTSPAELYDWLYDAERKAGDVGVVHTGSDSSAYTYIVYFAGDGDEGWKASVFNDKNSEDVEAEFKAYAAEHKVNDDEENPTIVTYVDEVFKRIKPISINV